MGFNQYSQPQVSHTMYSDSYTRNGITSSDQGVTYDKMYSILQYLNVSTAPYGHKTQSDGYLSDLRGTDINTIRDSAGGTRHLLWDYQIPISQLLYLSGI
ncbi:hypothetical protein KP79_PYT13407 [Mizuhopecten yessoensis]|uniref:Uncharacterized protein n=1 Tax=Mizuhopecten yessoensis TaxID=6573 RepID=A0A210R0K4_MIZYE|nr:hypothetical protein KP79_PYT13407 [Mizuhopecten yessoensis]